MRYFITTILFFIVSVYGFAQKCARPNEIFIKLISLDSITLNNYFMKDETNMYLQDSTEIFIRKSDLIEINEANIASIEFHTIKQLRQKEIEIRRCEVSKADGTIYLDININSIFKNIYMIACNEGLYYKFNVHWVDGTE